MKLKTTKIQLTFVKLPAAFDGFVIAHISDLHNACFGNNQSALIGAVKSISPNAIVITGDIIDKRRAGTEYAFSFLRQAVGIAPVYYTTGNHESRTAEFNSLLRELKSVGAAILRDSCIEVFRGDSRIVFAGLDDLKFTHPHIAAEEGTKLAVTRLRALLDGIEDFTVLLSHHPEYFAAYAEAGVDLTLCGHAHGGQWRFPLIGGLYAPDQGIFPKYTAGAYQKDGTRMVVSRGLGNSKCPWRLGNPPELVALTLKKCVNLSSNTK